MKKDVNSSGRGKLTLPMTPVEIHVSIINAQRTKKIDVRRLKQTTLALFKELKIARAELGVKLVGAKEMAQVNWQFLQHEGSTDVITFDHAEPNLGAKNSPFEIHGELFVCVDDAILQAEEFGTDWESEVVRYVVHGVLHLLGYDDLKPALRREMKRAENRLLGKLAKKISFTRRSSAVKLRP